jgi:coenzyme Q-binding protein COQ10
VSFASKTVLSRPKRIKVTSDESPFRQFRLSWIFESAPGPRCRVSLVTEFELRSRLLQRLVDQVMPNAVTGIIDAFETRAGQLYGNADQPPQASSR